MTKRFLPLVGVVVLLAGFAFFVAMGERATPKDEAPRSPLLSPMADSRSESAPPTTAPTEADSTLATVENTKQDGDQASEGATGKSTQENPAVVTGCGKPTPCPNRDCATCPYNIYLK